MQLPLIKPMIAIKAVDIKIGEGDSYLFYGNPKTGKTLLGCQFPKKVVILDFEHGHKTARGHEGIDIYPMYTIPRKDQWRQFELIINAVSADPEVKTIMIDNLEFLGLACMSYTRGKCNVQEDKLPGFKEWGLYGGFLRILIEKVRDNSGKILIINAHTHLDTSDSGVVMKGVPKVAGGLRYSIGGMFDEYYYLTNQAIGTAPPKFYIQTRGNNIYSCGSRTIDHTVTKIDWTGNNGYELIKKSSSNKIDFKPKLKK